MNSTILLDHDTPTADGQLTLRVLLRVEGTPPAADARAPLNLALVLDRSGSMAGEKLAAARKAAALLVRTLRPEDVISVVAYDDQVVTVAEPGTGAEQRDLPTTLGRIESGGSTNLSGGWLRGRELAGRGLREGGVNRVLLLTDGLANVGIKDPEQLAGLCREAARNGITTTTIGFGADFDEDLLRAMADAGGGATYFIEQPDQAPGIFEEELAGLLSIAAQNLSVRVQLAPAAWLAAVHHSYPSTHVPDGLRLDIGDLYAREPRVLLVELLVHVPDSTALVDVAKLTLTGDVLLPNGAVEHQEIEIPVSLSAVDGPRVDPVVRRELLLQEAARAREEALDRQDRGDHDGAVQALRTAYGKLRSAGYEDPQLLDEAADLQSLAERTAEHGFLAMDVKYAKQRAYDIKRSKIEGMGRYRREKET
jgi:Ca-activated chloride channel family protein